MRTKRILAMVLSIIMVVGLFPGIAFAAVPQNQWPSNITSNMVIGILNDNSVMPENAFPNEPGITGLTYYYVEFSTSNNGNVNFSLSTNYTGSNFSRSAGNYINTNAFWNDERIIMNNSGNAFGYYSPTGLSLNDRFFVTGFDEFFQEESIISAWMQKESISGNASEYKLLFYVIKYESSPWSSALSGYHLDAKVVKKNNVVLSYDANKPDGVTADIVLPNSHSVALGTAVEVEDLNSRYKNQSANGLNYVFSGWNTQADGSGTDYVAGNSVNVTEDIVLYAQWDITNKYEVRWVNYNDEELASTDHTLSYGDPRPDHPNENPTRPNDAAHKYTFSRWELVEGTYDETIGITEDLTYKAVYNSEDITYKAIVQVVLNGTFNQDGNPSSFNSGTLTDINVVADVDENSLYIKEEGGTDYIKLEKESDGIYSNTAIGNGDYLIYCKYNGDYIQIGTQALTINNADRTRYLPYYSVTYYEDADAEFRKECYYIGSKVDVITDIPQKDGEIFVNWDDDDDSIPPYNRSTAMQTVNITSSITKPYELTAQWVIASKVNVTVVVNHNDRDLNEVNEDLTIHLTAKNSDTGNYNEVSDTAKTFNNWFDGQSETTYHAGELYTNLSPAPDGVDDFYGAHAAIAGYRSNTDRQGGAVEIVENNGVYDVTIYLIYDPVGYELPFTVNIDPETPERMVPKAVDVKVTRWDGASWEPIPQHANQSVEVVIPDGELSGTGKVHVWGFDADNENEPYLYRIDVVRIDLGDYQLAVTDTDNENYTSSASGFFPAGAYTAEVVVTDSDKVAGDDLYGAHANSDYEYHGDIIATVKVNPYKIELDPNGGAWEDQSTDAKTIEDRFTVPDLSTYVPTNEHHTFAGWKLKDDEYFVKTGDEIVDFGIDVGGTLELEAYWKANITVKGNVVVNLGYPCDDESRQVRVSLQRKEGDGSYYVTAATKVVDIDPQDGAPEGFAWGEYSFADVPNLDTYSYRINVVIDAGGKIYYQNEEVTIATGNELYVKANYAENDMYEVVLGGDSEAIVNIYMEAEPFDLGYKIDVSAIAEGFRPTNLTLDLWHDHHITTAEGEVEEFHQIIAPMSFEGEFTNGVSEIKTFSVPPYHANGRLYDYAISIVDYTITEMGMDNLHYYHDTQTEGYYPAPFSILYTGPAEYSETDNADGLKQDVTLVAKFEPNQYSIAYNLNGGNWADGTNAPVHYKWSIEDTQIPIPVRDGYLFTGWTVAPEDDTQTDIYDATSKKILRKAWTDVAFTANWTLDEWTDGDPDAQDLGDEVPDEEQVRIIYVSANPAFGRIKDNKELDIVTLPATVTAAAEAIPIDVNHEFVKWTCEDITIANPENAVLSQEIAGEVGGKTYVFVAEFKAVDDWHDVEDKDDEPDGTPDLQQVRIIYRSGNIMGGNVSKGLDIITLEPAPTTSGNITVGNVTATANNGYEFSGWHCEKITFADVTPILNHSFNATGGETYEFVADFTPVDEWNAEDDTDTPDGTPDMYQVKVLFESADTSMGEAAPEVDIITIPGAVSRGTVKAEADATANSGYRFVKWTHEGNQVGTVAALDYDFAATGGEEYTFIAEFERGGGGGGGTTRYTLTYESNGGTEYAKETYNRNTTVEIDKTPTKEGYVFEGWYEDKELTKPVDEVKMTKNITVYAKWVEDNGSAGNGYDTPGSLNGEDHFAYVVGYPDGTVRPNDNISRAEVTAIFFRLLKPDEVRDKNLTDENDFADVNTADWYNTAISTMAKLGIVNGRTEESFVPNAFITRAEFAAICARFDNSEFEVVDNFTDVAGHWAEHDIHEAAAHGWIRGYEDGTFKPDQFISRAEAMTMINRVLNRVPETADDLLADMINWPDNSDKSVWYYLAVQEATNSHDYEMKNHIYEKWTALREVTDWTKYE